MKSLILSLLLSVAFSANAEIINNSQITVFGTPWGENFASWGPGNSIDDDPNTYWHGTNDLKIGMTDYLAYNFAKSYDIKKINFFNNEFDGYAIGELDIQISQDSTNGVDGRWVTIDHIDGDFNSANGDFSRSVNTGPVPWIRFLMNYQGRGAHGGSPAFLFLKLIFILPMNEACPHSQLKQLKMKTITTDSSVKKCRARLSTYLKTYPGSTA